MDGTAKPRLRREFRPRRSAPTADEAVVDVPAARPSPLARPVEATVLGLQQTAGNHAVAGLISGQRVSVQRAPTDDEARRLGIEPGSALDTPRGRANRAEQLRRAAEHPVDQVSIQGGVQSHTTQVAAPEPDARARARAADYTPTFTDWATLGPDGRRERIQNTINAQLAREGIPPVRVVFGAKAPGHAAFAADMWTMAVSAQSVDAAQPTAQEFATFVDNAVHETQHVVTTFRGIRVAMSRNSFSDRAYLPERIVAEATAANQRRSPEKELDEHAGDEAFEIYQVSIDPDRTNGINVPEGAVNREAVLARLETSKQVLADAQTLHAFNDAEARKHPNDPEYQRHAAESAAALEAATQENRAAHNGYLSLPEETFSWRTGSAVKSAVLERIALQARLDEARLAATEAAARQRALRIKGDARGASDALRRSREQQQLAAQIRTQLEGLTGKDPKLVGGRREVRDVPLTTKEIERAPRAPRDPDVPAPGATGAPPRPTQSTPATGGTAAPGAAAPGVAGAPATPTRPVVGAPASGLAAGSVPAGSGAKKVDAGDPAKAAATISPGPQPDGAVKRTVVAAPGGGIGVDWSTDAGQAGPGHERGGGVAVGGDNVVALSGRTSAPTTVGGSPGTVTTTGGVALTKGGNIEATLGKTEQVTHGVDAHGQPVTSSRTTTGGVALTDQGLGAQVGSSTTSQTGTTRSVTAGMTADAKGNVSAQVGAGISGKSGSGVTTTFKAGHQVDAGDPVEVQPGVFEVSYSVTDSRAVGLGGTASRTSGGPSIGGSVGSSQASSQTGVRRFTSKAEALRFKDNAALLIELGGGSEAPTTAAGALSIPVGETRGSGDAQGSNWGVSVSYGASIGYGQQKNTSHQLSVRRVSEQFVDVTAVVARDKIKDWSISGGITNTKGSSESSAFSVTFRFDLSTSDGRNAYEMYTRTGIPAATGSRLMSMTESKGAEDHDKVEVGPLGQAQWTGRTFESTTTTDQGVSKVFGGEQAHDQTPGRVGRWLGEDELHSSAQVTSHQENGRETGYFAEVKVKSDSGEYNRDKFGEIFMGAQKGKANAKPSGEWTLSAEIKKEVVHEMERDSSRFRGAKTNDEKMRILSEIVKENGAAAAGGMVRYGGNSKLAWTLELKGDENFPGVAGQQRLKEQQKKLDAILTTTPSAADSVVREAKEVMDKLQARRKEVSREDKYTDLPDELRQQQLALIDDHIHDFRAIHERALKAAVMTKPGEKAGEKADASSRTAAVPSSDIRPDQREADQLRDRSTALQDDIDKTRTEIFDASKAIHRAAQSVPLGVTSRQLSTQTTAWKAAIAVAYDLDRRQTDLKSTADHLREAWHDDTDPKARIEKLRALVSCLDDRLKLMAAQLYQVQLAAAAIKPITTENAMTANPAFWAGISGDELDED